MSDNTQYLEDDELRNLVDELIDAVWCSRGDSLTQNEAAEKRAKVAKSAILERERGMLTKVENRLLDRAISLENEDSAVKWDDVQEVLATLTQSPKKKGSK